MRKRTESCGLTTLLQQFQEGARWKAKFDRHFAVTPILYFATSVYFVSL